MNYSNIFYASGEKYEQVPVIVYVRMMGFYLVRVRLIGLRAITYPGPLPSKSSYGSTTISTLPVGVWLTQQPETSGML